MNGTVFKSTGSWYYVKLKNNIKVKCRIKGKFRIKGIKSTNPIAVGDNVNVIKEGDDYLINNILERKNYIVRKSVKLSKQTHIVASNIDLALLFITIKSPITSIMFINRFLVTAEAYQIPTYLIFNKIDIYNKKEIKELKELSSKFMKIGYKCFEISALKISNLDSLINEMENKTTLLSGNSGVGKSTFLNSILPELNIKTNNISEANKTGVHTTTFAEMYELNSKSLIIDTPGIKGLGLVEINKSELADYFPEFKQIKNKCKYNNCIHLNEPECSVKKALKEKKISSMRYNSYLNLLEDHSNQYR